MQNKDTVRLLRECRSGVQMATLSFADVYPHAVAPTLREIITASKAHHEKLGKEADSLLDACGEPKKQPNAMIKGLSHVKTEAELRMHRAGRERDRAIVSLLYDGCHMGIKSLSRYLCEYPTASDESRALAKSLIELEESLSHSLRPHLA